MRRNEKSVFPNKKQEKNERKRSHNSFIVWHRRPFSHITVAPNAFAVVLENVQCDHRWATCDKPADWLSEHRTRCNAKRVQRNECDNSGIDADDLWHKSWSVSTVTLTLFRCHGNIVTNDLRPTTNGRTRSTNEMHFFGSQNANRREKRARENWWWRWRWQRTTNRNHFQANIINNVWEKVRKNKNERRPKEPKQTSDASTLIHFFGSFDFFCLIFFGNSNNVYIWLLILFVLSFVKCFGFFFDEIVVSSPLRFSSFPSNRNGLLFQRNEIVSTKRWIGFGKTTWIPRSPIFTATKRKWVKYISIHLVDVCVFKWNSIE